MTPGVVGHCVGCGFSALYMAGFFCACHGCGENLCLECSAKSTPYDTVDLLCVHSARRQEGEARRRAREGAAHGAH